MGEATKIREQFCKVEQPMCRNVSRRAGSEKSCPAGEQELGMVG